MDYIKASRSFLSGRYVSEALRVTAGILAPAFVMYYFDMLAAGIVMSVGALCVSATDNPGPVQDRTNGMFICILLTGLVSVLTCFATVSPLLTCIFITICGFVFSMLTVYGIRSSSLGIAALLVMILNLEPPKHGMEIWTNALYIICGGTWFMIFSLMLYKIRPLKLIRQMLGDTIQSISLYLYTRSEFYDKDPAYEKIYQSLLQQQVHIQTQQTQLGELLFKTREVTKESTHTGRILLMIYLEGIELFESVMTTIQQYATLHTQFDETPILDDFRDIIRAYAHELDNIGIAIKSGSSSRMNKTVPEQLKKLRSRFEELRHNFMTGENVDSFIGLGRILDNMRDLLEKIKVLHYYTTNDRKIKKIDITTLDEEDFIEDHNIRPSLFIDNLNINSLVFRHSIRVAAGLLLGFLVSLFFNIGHSYWILLTIVVILKPAYSLTKERNKARLAGTLLGIIIGVAILYFIHHNMTLLIIMIVLMTASYMFLRTSYFINVLLMTPYILIFFHLIYPNDLRVVLTDRLLDTSIGSAIAFLASLFLVPVWEHRGIKAFMIKMLEDDQHFYNIIAGSFTSTTPVNIRELLNARRSALVSLANLSDAFNRMLSEPKRFQKGIESIHQFVVLNYTLNSHLSTLSFYLKAGTNNYRSENILPVIKATEDCFIHAAHFLESGVVTATVLHSPLQDLNEDAVRLLDIRKLELERGEMETDTKQKLVKVKSVIDQFNHIYSIAGDIQKVVSGQLSVGEN